jgi:predicted transcriptional regulator
MQLTTLTIQLDSETARQLEVIQKQTNQDYISVIQQGIGLYHQQVQPHYTARIEVPPSSDLLCATSASPHSDN